MYFTYVSATHNAPKEKKAFDEYFSCAIIISAEKCFIALGFAVRIKLSSNNCLLAKTQIVILQLERSSLILT